MFYGSSILKLISLWLFAIFNISLSLILIVSGPQYALRKLYHESPRLICVLYTSPTCGPCRTLKPILSKVQLSFCISNVFYITVTYQIKAYLRTTFLWLKIYVCDGLEIWGLTWISIFLPDMFWGLVLFYGPYRDVWN